MSETVEDRFQPPILSLFPLLSSLFVDYQHTAHIRRQPGIPGYVDARANEQGLNDTKKQFERFLCESRAIKKIQFEILYHPRLKLEFFEGKEVESKGKQGTNPKNKVEGSVLRGGSPAGTAGLNPITLDHPFSLNFSPLSLLAF